MADIYEVSERFRRELLRGDRELLREMVRAYAAAYQRIRKRLNALLEEMEGKEITLGWLFERGRLTALERQIRQELERFARLAARKIAAGQRWAATLGMRHALGLLQEAMGKPPPGVTITFTKLPREAVMAMVGFAADGSPLRNLLDELGPDASRRVRQELITAVATGQHPNWVARRIRAVFGGNMARALTIARTEMLRSYREASWRIYQANQDVVEGWIWHSAANRNTCAFCWAMHGTWHPLHERMATHPRCRCSMIPATRSWEELGFRGVRAKRLVIPRGEDLFAELSEEEQLAILGKAKFEAYRSGLIGLSDLVGFYNHPRWGRVGYERSLTEVLGGRRWR